MLETSILLGGLAVFTLLRIALTRPRGRKEDAPRAAVAPLHRMLAGIPEGQWVTVIGQVRATSDTIEATLSGQRCVASSARAKAWHSKKIPHLIGDVSETMSRPFVLEVVDGELIVDGEIELEHPTREVAALERGRAFLVAHKLERYLDSTTFEEAIVVAGDRIAVTGVVVRDHVAEGDYRETPERMRIVAPPRGKVILARPPKVS